jgi:two-component system nitrate/nitrite response regulator NarL
MSALIRILLVDDHTLFREGLFRLLDPEPDMTVVGHCAAISEAMTYLSTKPIDVVVLDYDLGGEGGIELLKMLRQTDSEARVLMLTAGMIPSAVLNALDSGAAGVILKHSGTRQLVEAVRRVANGETWWDTSVLREALINAKSQTALAPATPDLTGRQRSVLHGVLDGLANKEIAASLRVSETSIKASIQELFAKAGVRTRSQLVRVAIERFASEWLREKKP